LFNKSTKSLFLFLDGKFWQKKRLPKGKRKVSFIYMWLFFSFEQLLQQSTAFLTSRFTAQVFDKFRIG